MIIKDHAFLKAVLEDDKSVGKGGEREKQLLNAD